MFNLSGHAKVVQDTKVKTRFLVVEVAEDFNVAKAQVGWWIKVNKNFLHVEKNGSYIPEIGVLGRFDSLDEE